MYIDTSYVRPSVPEFSQFTSVQIFWDAIIFLVTVKGNMANLYIEHRRNIKQKNDVDFLHKWTSNFNGALLEF